MNLIDMVKGQLTDEVLGHLGKAVNLPATDITKAMGAILPAQFSAIVQQGSTQQGAQSLLSLAGNFANMGNFGSLLGATGGAGNILKMGESLLPSLFGGNLGGIVGGIAKMTGLGAGPLGGLMSLAAPLIMGQLGGMAKTQGLNPAGLMTMLGGLQGPLASMMPAGLGNILGSLGGAGAALGAVQGLGNMATGAVGNIGGAAAGMGAAGLGVAGAAAQAAKGGLPGWLWPLVGVVAAVGIGWALLGRGTPAPDIASAVTTPVVTDTMDGANTTMKKVTDVMAVCTKPFSLGVKDGATVTEGFRFGGMGAAKGYQVTVTRSDGRVIGTKQLPLEKDCSYGYDSKPGKGKVKYEIRPFGAELSTAATQTLTLNVQ